MQHCQLHKSTEVISLFVADEIATSLALMSRVLALINAERNAAAHTQTTAAHTNTDTPSQGSWHDMDGRDFFTFAVVAENGQRMVLVAPANIIRVVLQVLVASSNGSRLRHLLLLWEWLTYGRVLHGIVVIHFYSFNICLIFANFCFAMTCLKRYS